MQIHLKVLFLVAFLSCAKEPPQPIVETSQPIVVISKFAPDAYRHYIGQDSIGKEVADTTGGYSPVPSPRFDYIDGQGDVQQWIPKPGKTDTLTLLSFSEHLELSSYNDFALIKNTFLLRQGDTVVIEYPNKLPMAKVLNRKTSEIELNYNSYRHRQLFQNKFTSHRKVMLGILLEKNLTFNDITLKYYQEALNDAEREKLLLDSLYDKKVITKVNYEYRTDALKGLMQKHQDNRLVKKWVEENQRHSGDGFFHKVFEFDISKADSLMTYSHFRDYLMATSRYNLPFISKFTNSSGASFVDSRIRFDSIVKDPRFTAIAKNYLLHDAYNGILRDYKVADKEEYFEKLLKESTSLEQVQTLAEEQNLSFDRQDELLLTSLNGDTLTYQNLIEQNLGTWIYIDFWASWCLPCRREMPNSRKMYQSFKQENVIFIYLALNDKIENWKQAITADSIQFGAHYFIENGNTSQVLEDLDVTTIPHYLIYDTKGNLINGFAEKPGEGAKIKLYDYIKR